VLIDNGAALRMKIPTSGKSARPGAPGAIYLILTAQLLGIAPMFKAVLTWHS
jgi:hypothetical protein